MKAFLKVIIEDFETNRKIKSNRYSYRNMNDFKKG